MAGLPDLDSLLVSALRAAGRAAPEILDVYNRSFAVDRKADLSPITEADRRSDRIISAELVRATGFAVLSEEGRAIDYEQRRTWPRFWLVDPLDGTKEFVKRNGEFTINIAFIEGTTPVLGVVYAPVLDLLYFAHDGIGAYKLPGMLAFPESADNGRPDFIQTLLTRSTRLEKSSPLRLEAGRKHPRITVIASRSHSSRAFEEYLQELRRNHAERLEVTSIGSALKPCLVAEGQADIYPRFGPTMEWDTAAAHAVVTAVGKRMAAYDSGEELTYNKADLVNPSFLVY
jgi:3'(2'), 5'-bisphosphate nucleotidase